MNNFYALKLNRCNFNLGGIVRRTGAIHCLWISFFWRRAVREHIKHVVEVGGSQRGAVLREEAAQRGAKEEARESFEWYPKTGARQIATLTDWMAERKQELGSYSYAADMKKTDESGMLDLLSL